MSGGGICSPDGTGGLREDSCAIVLVPFFSEYANASHTYVENCGEVTGIYCSIEKKE